MTEALRKLSRPTSLSGVSANTSPHVLPVASDDWHGDWRYTPVMEPWDEWSSEWQYGPREAWETGYDHQDGDVEQDTYLDEVTSGLGENMSDEEANILATYTQTRAALRQSQLSRGFHQPKGDKQKQKKGGWPHKGQQKGWYHGGGKMHATKSKPHGKGSRLETLILRTHCLSCGQMGHWARGCPLKDKGGSKSKGKCVTFAGVGDTEGLEYAPETGEPESYAELRHAACFHQHPGILQLHMCSDVCGCIDLLACCQLGCRQHALSQRSLVLPSLQSPHHRQPQLP